MTISYTRQGINDFPRVLTPAIFIESAPAPGLAALARAVRCRPGPHGWDGEARPRAGAPGPAGRRGFLRASAIDNQYSGANHPVVYSNLICRNGSEYIQQYVYGKTGNGSCNSEYDFVVSIIQF